MKPTQIYQDVAQELPTVEWPNVENDEEQAVTPPPMRAPRVLCILGVLLALISGLYAWSASYVSALIFAALSLWALLEFYLMRRLLVQVTPHEAQVDAKAAQQDIAQIIKQRDYALAPWSQASQSIDESYSGAEIYQLFSQQCLAPLDDKAKALIARHAAENGAVVALSPLAVLDMLWMGWRTWRMVRQLSHLYGIGDKRWASLWLAQAVLRSWVYAGISEIIADMGADWLGNSLAATISTRSAQGIGAALLTIRLGLISQRLLRPIAFSGAQRPRMADYRSAVVEQIKQIVSKKQQTGS